ncbi:hypothetical protein Plhal304r1_c038g0114031 [Plasmopara halstedii]
MLVRIVESTRHRHTIVKRRATEEITKGLPGLYGTRSRPNSGLMFNLDTLRDDAKCLGVIHNPGLCDVVLMTALPGSSSY